MLIHTISYTLCHFPILSSLVCFYIYTLDNTLSILSKYLTIRSYNWRALSFTVSYLSDIRTLFQKIKNRHTTCLFFYFALIYFMLSLFCHARKKKSVIFYAFFYTIDLMFLSSNPLVSTVLSKVSGYQFIPIHYPFCFGRY